MDKKEAALLIKQIDSLYPGRINLEPMTVEIWHKALQAQSYDITIEKLIRFSRESKFPPSVADLFHKEQEPYKTNILDQIKEWEANATGK